MAEEGKSFAEMSGEFPGGQANSDRVMSAPEGERETMYLRFKNGTFWADEAMQVKPVAAKIKSHVSVDEIPFMRARNNDFDRWVYNEAAGVAADVEADRQGNH